MKQISYILMTVGGIMTACGAMCDADGIYYSILIAVIAVGLILVITGMKLYQVAEYRERQRRMKYFQKRRRDRFESEVEFIDLDKKIAP